MSECAPTADYELSLHAEGYRRIAGVDEVGRGSWAGPVVAAAVVLPPITAALLERLSGLRDSKQLSPAERNRLVAEIVEVAEDLSAGWASHHIVDRVGIAVANRLALLRAARRLKSPPDVLLLDHFRLPGCPIPQLALPHGDARVLSIAAASVVAKVLRDRWMERCSARIGGYGFEHNKGYGTAGHRAALHLLGPSRLHRRSFEPCASLYA